MSFKRRKGALRAKLDDVWRESSERLAKNFWIWCDQLFEPHKCFVKSNLQVPLGELMGSLYTHGLGRYLSNHR